ncbi:hypothetical protein GCM10010388_00340 [Streptomyces mauvecolor]
MAHQDYVTQTLVLYLGNDVLDVSRLPRRYTLLVSKTGQRQRIDAVASRAQIRHHLAPRPRPEPCTCNQHEIHHARTVAEPPDDQTTAKDKTPRDT